MIKKLVLVFLLLFVSSCATSPRWGESSCPPEAYDKSGIPCWVNNKPNDGVVLSMSEHLDPAKTRDLLFKKALIELAANIQGVDVSENVIVKKQTTVLTGDNVKDQAQVISLATVKTTNGSVGIKARIRGEWKNPTSRKLYLWVVPTP